jgi:hypothetical protein
MERLKKKAVGMKAVAFHSGENLESEFFLLNKNGNYSGRREGAMAWDF